MTTPEGLTTLLKYPDAAIYLDMSEASLRRLVDEGELPIVRIRRRVWFDVADLEALRDRSKVRV